MNYGSRIYVLDGDNYKIFKLKNREFTLDVDVSKLPCGLNGAVYFVEMDKKGDWDGNGNTAGAKYGTGYCDAQCPHDEKFMKGEGVECGDNAKGERYLGMCDKDGCDYNSYRLG